MTAAPDVQRWGFGVTEDPALKEKREKDLAPFAQKHNTLPVMSLKVKSVLPSVHFVVVERHVI